MSNTKSDKTIITINGVNLRFGTIFGREYNLSILKHWDYQIKPNGHANKKKPVLDPLDWIKSPDGQEHIKQIYSHTENVIYLATHAPITICTNSHYIWLGYLKHCIGNIDTAINAELAD